MDRHVERKALQIHNLYVVVIKGTKKSPPQPIRHWSVPCAENGRHTFMTSQAANMVTRLNVNKRTT
jgi:hypothetical protein